MFLLGLLADYRQIHIQYVYNTIIVKRYIHVYLQYIYIWGISCKCCDYITNSSNANSEKSRCRYKAFSSKYSQTELLLRTIAIKDQIYLCVSLCILRGFWVYVCVGRQGLGLGLGYFFLVFIIQRYAFNKFQVKLCKQFYIFQRLVKLYKIHLVFYT